jgi:hypothetical protein
MIDGWHKNFAQHSMDWLGGSYGVLHEVGARTQA